MMLAYRASIACICAKSRRMLGILFRLIRLFHFAVSPASTLRLPRVLVLRLMIINHPRSLSRQFDRIHDRHRNKKLKFTRAAGHSFSAFNAGYIFSLILHRRPARIDTPFPFVLSLGDPSPPSRNVQ